MEYKMICIDLDGTLLNKIKRISTKDRQAIKAAYSKGIKVVITTGRLWNNAAYFSKILGVKAPVIGANGAVIIDSDNEVIYKSVFSVSQCEKIHEILKKYKLFFHAHTVDSIYSNNKLFRIATKIYLKNQSKVEGLAVKINKINDIEEWNKIINENKDEIVKFIACTPNRSNMEKVKKELAEIEGINIFPSGGYNIEINKFIDCKGNAVKKLMDRYGLKKEEVICIGDNENDISMIQAAGLGVAMGNAIKKVKENADYVTDTNNNSGVSKVINEFIFLQKG